MRLDLVRAQATSLHHLTGKHRITVVVIYPVCRDLDVARLLPAPFFPRKMFIAFMLIGSSRPRLAEQRDLVARPSLAQDDPDAAGCVDVVRGA